MADAAQIAERRPALAGRSFDTASVSIKVAPPAERMVLRAPEGSLARLSAALGVELPRRPKSSARTGTRRALWLGPDEWLLIDAEGSGLADALSGVEALHSAVDVSHRNVAVLVEGPAAEAVLSAGCPQDLRVTSFPEGAASRTVFGKAETVIHRVGAQSFHVEVWRTFATYVFDLLEDAARSEAA